MTSLSSEYSIASISSVNTYISSQPEDSTTFQNRRRRAAKLTQFFGVDYRDLMSEILDKIQRGVEEESGRGGLEPDEVQVRIDYFCMFVGGVGLQLLRRICYKS